jgi:predicted aconitase with swiveling domain
MSKLKVIKCRKIARGQASGYALVTSEPLSFLGGVDPESGRIIDPHHELSNQVIKDKILIIPSGKGSTVGSYVIFQMAKNKTAPQAIIAIEAEPIIATGAIMAGIPMVDHPQENILSMIKDGDFIEVDSDSESIKIGMN